MVNRNGIPTTNKRFSLIWNDIASCIYAAGSASEYPSFVQRLRMRTDNAGFNVDAGFFAAMSMLDKRIVMNYIPHTYLRINGVPIHYIGERNNRSTEVIMEGDPKKDKFILYYIYGEEVIGFATVGYQNAHLFLWEAMKLLVMPPAPLLRDQQVTHKNIIQNVLRLRPDIEAKRGMVAKLPSIQRTEFTREFEKRDKFKAQLKQNLEIEKIK